MEKATLKDLGADGRIKRIGCEGVKWVTVLEDKFQTSILVDGVLDLRKQLKMDNFSVKLK
jgi:hypothetical protein